MVKTFTTNGRTYTVTDNGDILYRGRKLKPFTTKDGYLRIRIGGRSGKKELVHRIIASCFIENPMNKPTVNHINGIKTDNRVQNLEWATFSENMKHSYDNGLRKNTTLPIPA